MNMIRTLKLLICLEMFVLGLFVGYGLFVLHWFADYTPPAMQQLQTPIQVTNITEDNGYQCFTESQPGEVNKVICSKP